MEEGRKEDGSDDVGDGRSDEAPNMSLLSTPFLSLPVIIPPISALPPLFLFFPFF